MCIRRDHTAVTGAGGRADGWLLHMVLRHPAEVLRPGATLPFLGLPPRLQCLSLSHCARHSARAPLPRAAAVASRLWASSCRIRCRSKRWARRAAPMMGFARLPSRRSPGCTPTEPCRRGSTAPGPTSGCAGPVRPRASPYPPIQRHFNAILPPTNDANHCHGNGHLKVLQRFHGRHKLLGC